MFPTSSSESPIPLSTSEGVKKLGAVAFYVIPAKARLGEAWAGIQCFQDLKDRLDPGFHRGDDLSAISSHPLSLEGEKLCVARGDDPPFRDCVTIVGA